MIGKTLAHYEVTAHLGTGGMGEVYRALDTKLRRDVAIKLLPAVFAADPMRMARFEQEARSLAALNHPNVSGIFGIEQHDDHRFLVMELAEGEDLSERIKRGPLPVEDVIDIARQIAAGLEDAHARGIVHRDLKPANIKLTPTGEVKILDFGLAKALTDEADPATSEYDIANSPTIINTVTQPGLILGTAAYMSPEQARGRPVDWRADIWAFGCVMYEMLTGRAAYTRPTVADILAAIIERSPDFDELPADLPPSLRRLLLRCLVKDQRNRLQAIGDARVELQDIQDGTAGPDDAALATIAGGRSSLRNVMLAAGLSFVVAAVATFVWLNRGTAETALAPDREPLHLSLELPEGYPLTYVGGSGLGAEFTAFDLSDDGTRLVYLSRAEAFEGLVVLDLATGDHVALAGTEGAYLPKMSPDGHWVVFMSLSAISRVSAAGGTVEFLAPASDGWDLIWSRDGNLYWVDRQGGELRGMRPEPGAPITTLINECNCRSVSDWVTAGELLIRQQKTFSRLLPDGTLVPAAVTGSHATVLGADIGLTTRSGRLVGSRIDVGGARPDATQRTVLTGLRTTPLTGAGQYTVAKNGMLAYLAGPPADVTRLVRRYPDGRVEALPFVPRSHGSMDVSPDGSRITVVVNDAGENKSLEVLDIAKGTRQVVGDGSRVSNPIWHADGTSVTYTVGADSVLTVVNHPLDSIDPPQHLFDGRGVMSPWDWSQDGGTLLFGEGPPKQMSLAVWDRETGQKTELVSTPSGSLWAGQFSPDERFIAYTQVSGAGSEVYVVPYPPTGQRWLVSGGPGEEPVWRLDSQELVFRRGKGWYSVAYDNEAGFRFAAPELMFEGSYVNIGGMEYRVLADGSLVLMESIGTGEKSTRLGIVLNWDVEVDRVLGD